MKRSFGLALLFALSGACDKAVPDEVVAPQGPSPGDGADSSEDGSGDDDFDGSDGEFPLDGGRAMDAGLDAALPPPEPFTKLGLLKAAGRCAIAAYEDFDEKARALRTATSAWADAPDSETRSAARSAWRRAYASWQEAELFRFGPAARAMDDPGGQGMRDQIYAFPQSFPCIVDQSIFSQSYEDAFDSLLIGARGLGGLEYLLYFTSSSNSCPAQHPVNKPNAWDALSASELAQRRSAYAYAAADDVVKESAKLLDAWSEEGGNFFGTLTKTGSGKTYTSQQAALNAVSHGLFYLEKEMKDLKVGQPIGLLPGCATMSCPEYVEARYAKVSTQNLRANLTGFRKLFEGCGPGYSGLGFDDWLREVGAGELEQKMLKALTNAERAVDELEPKLEEAVVSDRDAVLEVHAALKALNDLLKGDFVTVLNLELPMGAEGDND